MTNRWKSLQLITMLMTAASNVASAQIPASARNIQVSASRFALLTANTPS